MQGLGADRAQVVPGAAGRPRRRGEERVAEICDFTLRGFRPVAAALVVTLFGVTLSFAADLTADQVREMLAKADPATRIDFTGRDLSDLELSRLDFKRADLSGANLFAARLVSSNLQGAKLARANLNGAWLMGTNFAGADLSGSSMLGLVILGGDVKEKPSFARANLSGVRMIADLPGADLQEADLSRAKLGVDIRNQGMGQMRTDLTGANLAGANLRDADLNRSLVVHSLSRGKRRAGAAIPDGIAGSETHRVGQCSNGPYIPRDVWAPRRVGPGKVP